MRIDPITPQRAGFFTRLWFRMMRAGVGQVTGKAVLPESVQIVAHQPALAWGTTLMEAAQSQMSSLPPRVKALAGYATARMIGCPF
ncbi:MAG: hypothetical protein U0Q16_15585 [Bryobacteraceae bacterium]